MQIVIDISKEDFERCKKKYLRRINVMSDAIANGTVLPEEYGDLVDRDAINEKFYEYARYTDDSDKRQLDYFSQCLDTATPILPFREL